MNTETIVEQQETVNPPRWHEIPILGTIAEEDLNNAGRFSWGDQCLLATMLKRMGYGKLDLCLYVDHAIIDGYIFDVKGFVNDVGWDPHTETYNRKVIGKQFIFYPRHMK